MALVMGGTVLVQGIQVATDNLLVDTDSSPSTSSKVNRVRAEAVWAVRACLLLVIIQSSALYLNPVLTRFPTSRCRCRSVGRSAHRRRCRRRL